MRLTDQGPDGFIFSLLSEVENSKKALGLDKVPFEKISQFPEARHP